MVGYRLLTYEYKSASGAGILVGDRVYRVSDVIEDERDVLGLLQDWESAHVSILAFLDSDKSKQISYIPLADITLQAPIQYPSNFYCAGANYWDHLKEMGEFVRKMTGNLPSMEKAPEPWFFVKTTRGTIIGDGPARIPGFTAQLDWEAELGVVIGSATRDMSEDDAMSAVAGYVIVNDLSARDLIKREGSPFIYDWIGQKCFDDAAPMGPWFTPAAYIDDPQKLDVTLAVNGVLKQSSNTDQMVHSIAEQVAYLSRHVTLYPGDVIATGTPSGVGMPHAEFLRPGDEVVVEISGLGKLSSRMVSDS